VWPYVEELAEHSEYFDAQLQAAREDSGVS
jgi:hypothetical protein